MNGGFHWRFPLKSLSFQHYLAGDDLPFRRHVATNACFSITAAATKLTAALMLTSANPLYTPFNHIALTWNRLSYRPETMRVVLLSTTTLEYSILAFLILSWTFPRLGYKALSSHLGCFVFATVAYLTIVIASSVSRGTKAFSLCLLVRAHCHVLQKFAHQLAGQPSCDFYYPSLAVGSSSGPQECLIRVGYQPRPS